jgi:hypothetical protein
MKARTVGAVSDKTLLVINVFRKAAAQGLLISASLDFEWFFPGKGYRHTSLKISKPASHVRAKGTR